MTPARDDATYAPADDDWIAVDDGAAVATARRRAAALATARGLDSDRVAEVEIIASELASNLVKHGGGGDLTVRSRPGGGIQLVATDDGPGTRHLDSLIRDGISTVGTLGVGLGAVRRLASHLDLWSAPARGTVVVADMAAAKDVGRAPVGHLVRPLRGESVSGDAVAFRQTPTGWLLMVADGLGHGPLAAEASRRAVEVFAAAASSPADLVRRMHNTLGSSRGVAVAITEVDLRRRVLTHAGVGNISGRLVGPGARVRSMLSQPGIVGHKVPAVRELQLSLEDGVSLVVLHSDGLTERWDAADLPSVARHGPTVCASTLIRDAGTRRDDACVLTLQVSL